VLEPRVSSKKDRKPKKYGINPGVKFQSWLEFEMWIKDYTVKYHRPYKVRASPTDALNFGAAKTVCSALDPPLGREAMFTSNRSSKHWGSRK
jgi:hypothetical protein